MKSCFQVDQDAVGISFEQMTELFRRGDFTYWPDVTDLVPEELTDSGYVDGLLTADILTDVPDEAINGLAERNMAKIERHNNSNITFPLYLDLFAPVMVVPGLSVKGYNDALVQVKQGVVIHSRAIEGPISGPNCQMIAILLGRLGLSADPIITTEFDKSDDIRIGSKTVDTLTTKKYLPKTARISPEEGFSIISELERKLDSEDGSIHSFVNYSFI